MLNKIIKFITTFGFIGYMPLAPGSMASIAGGLLAVYISSNLAVYLSVFTVVTVLGFLASGRMEAIVGAKDPSCVVIDEVSGIMIAFFLLPQTASVLVTAFFLFRAFDMFKIYPADKFESVKGGGGIMMDDIVAGIYTNLTMHLALRLISWVR